MYTKTKLNDVISWANDIRPNAIDDEKKAAVVMQLEAEIAEMMGESLEEADLSVVFPEDKELRLPQQYSDAYEWYLVSQIDLMQMETDKYGTDAAVADSAISRAFAWYRRNYRPESGENWRTL